MIRLERQSEKLVTPYAFNDFMSLCWQRIQNTKKASKNIEDELIRITALNFQLYIRLRRFSSHLQYGEKSLKWRFKRWEQARLYNEFAKKCWGRVSGGPGTVNKGYKIKKSYILCDNLQDSEEEMLDVNNYNFMLWLKMKNFPKYLVHEINRTDYRKKSSTE